MHAVQDETSGINWKKGAVLSSKTLPHSVCVRAPAQFRACAWPHLLSAAQCAGGGRKGGRKEHFFLKQFHTRKKRLRKSSQERFYIHNLFIYLCQNEHGHIMMRLIPPIISNLCSFSCRSSRFLLSLITSITIAARSLRLSAQCVGQHCTKRC